MIPHVLGPNGQYRHLGKPDPFRPDSRDLLVKKYIDKAALAEAIATASTPLNCDWSAFPTPSGALPTPDTDPLYNNVAGCCVLSGPGHMVNRIGKQAGRSDLVVTAKMVQAAYTKYTGYVPGDSSTDNGWVVRDMLKAWSTDGLYGTKCVAFGLVDQTNPDEVALANWIGMGTIGGYSLPLASQDQNDDQGRPLWSVPPGGFTTANGPGTWGGHCIWTHGPNNGNTWGESVLFTPPWQLACCDEMWLAAIDAANVKGRIPAGFAWADFLADVQARKQ
jgi:hypothetical protein